MRTDYISNAQINTILSGNARLRISKSRKIYMHTRSQLFNRKSLFSDAYTNNRKNPSVDVERLLLFWHYRCFGSFKALRDRKQRILDLFTLRIQSFPFFIHRGILERPTSRRTSESSMSSHIIINKVHFHCEFDCLIWWCRRFASGEIKICLWVVFRYRISILVEFSD